MFTGTQANKWHLNKENRFLLAVCVPLSHSITSIVNTTLRLGHKSERKKKMYLLMISGKFHSILGLFVNIVDLFISCSTSSTAPCFSRHVWCKSLYLDSYSLLHTHRHCTSCNGIIKLSPSQPCSFKNDCKVSRGSEWLQRERKICDPFLWSLITVMFLSDILHYIELFHLFYMHYTPKMHTSVFLL